MHGDHLIIVADHPTTVTHVARDSATLSFNVAELKRLRAALRAFGDRTFLDDDLAPRALWILENDISLQVVNRLPQRLIVSRVM